MSSPATPAARRGDRAARQGGRHWHLALLATALLGCGAGRFVRGSAHVGALAVRVVEWNPERAEVGSVSAVADAGDDQNLECRRWNRSRAASRTATQNPPNCVQPRWQFADRGRLAKRTAAVSTGEWTVAGDALRARRDGQFFDDVCRCSKQHDPDGLFQRSGITMGCPTAATARVALSVLSARQSDRCRRGRRCGRCLPGRAGSCRPRRRTGCR